VSGKKTRFLDPSEIERGLEEIAQLARAQKVRAALIGGAALQLLGSDRLTKDVDVAADELVEGIEILGPLDFGGIKGTTPSGVPVDCVVRADKYQRLYEAAIERAVHVEGVPLPVVVPEFLIAMKMVAGRLKDEVDLEFLIADSGADHDKTRAFLEEFLGPFAVDEFERLRDEIAWRRQRGR
jgi:hypothetical protein